MHAVIHHAIADPAKWDQTTRKIMSMIEQGKLPKGVRALQYLPSTDGRMADCLWETDSLNSLRQFIDRETGGAARNEYFEVKTDAAIGLPKAEEHMAAHAA
jgi:hypothetical protein